MQGTETIKATGKATIESGQEILLRAPVIKIQGVLTTEGYEGGPGSSTLYGNFTVRQGGAAVPDADVSAGSVSLRGHTHTGVQSGGASSSRMAQNSTSFPNLPIRWARPYIFRQGSDQMLHSRCRVVKMHDDVFRGILRGRALRLAD